MNKGPWGTMMFSVPELLKLERILRWGLDRAAADAAISSPFLWAWLHKLEKHAGGTIHKGRWGTIMFSVPELLKVEKVLRWAWDKDAFMGRAGADGANDDEDTNLAAEADKAISSPFWWGWLHMLEHVCKVVRRAISWIEGCSCHSELLHGDVSDFPPELVRQWRSFPMRGPPRLSLITSATVPKISHVTTRAAVLRVACGTEDRVLRIPRWLDLHGTRLLEVRRVVVVDDGERGLQEQDISLPWRFAR